MDICVVGPGAIGSVFGGLLQQAGHNVTLLAGRKAYEEAIAKQGGLIIDDNEGRRKLISVNMVSDASLVKACELVIVLVKSTQSKTIAPLLPKILASNGIVLTLQNGLGSAEEYEKYIDSNQLMLGTTTCGGTMLAPGHVVHTSYGNSFIGWRKGGGVELAQPYADLLIGAGFPVKVDADMNIKVWEKLMVNVGVNAVAAITGAFPGPMRGNPDTLSVCTGAIKEAMAVAKAQNIAVKPDFVERFCAMGRDSVNRPSMWQDIQAKRLTEIDNINGAICSLGKQYNIPTPVNDTLTGLVKTIESLY